jgi:hypothetical protein
LLGTFAFIFSFLYAFWCESIKFEPAEGSEAETLRFGPWYKLETVVETVDVSGGPRYFVRDTCQNYPSHTDIDSKWKAARAFTVMAPLIGGLLTAVLWFNNCLYRLSDGAWKYLAVAGFMVIVTLFQGLTFLFLNSSACEQMPLIDEGAAADENQVQVNEYLAENYADECEWDTGSTLNAVAVALYFVTGVVMLRQGAPKRPAVAPPETQQVTYQKTENPDGTTVVQEVQVIKGTAVPPPEQDAVEKPVAEAGGGAI